MSKLLKLDGRKAGENKRRSGTERIGEEDD